MEGCWRGQGLVFATLVVGLRLTCLHKILNFLVLCVCRHCRLGSHRARGSLLSGLGWLEGLCIVWLRIFEFSVSVDLEVVRIEQDQEFECASCLWALVIEVV